jgi:hypothetical protein
MGTGVKDTVGRGDVCDVSSLCRHYSEKTVLHLDGSQVFLSFYLTPSVEAFTEMKFTSCFSVCRDQTISAGILITRKCWICIFWHHLAVTIATTVDTTKRN